MYLAYRSVFKIHCFWQKVYPNSRLKKWRQSYFQLYTVLYQFNQVRTSKICDIFCNKSLLMRKIILLLLFCLSGNGLFNFIILAIYSQLSPCGHPVITDEIQSSTGWKLLEVWLKMNPAIADSSLLRTPNYVPRVITITRVDRSLQW